MLAFTEQQPDDRFGVPHRLAEADDLRFVEGATAEG